MRRQAEVTLVANDAALSGQYDRAEELLKQGPPRTIAAAYKTVTPESSEHGDFAESGWDDEEGDEIEVDSDDIEEQAEAGSHAPAADAVADKAVEWLRGRGASEASSSSSFHPGVWYSTEFEIQSYGTGEERSEDFFLRNFAEDEERRVFERFHARRRR